jgi:predicted nucleic acid-binding Zn ribbon protein
MDNMKDIVDNVIGKLSQKQSYNHDRLQQIWSNLLNEKELQHTRIFSVEEGTLRVNVDSPAWLYQMKMKRNELIRRLKQEDYDIRSIVFKIGKVR